MQEEKNTNSNSEENYIEEYISGDDYREQLQDITSNNSQRATWQQKLAVVFLVVFGISAFVLWIVQFRSGLQVGEPLTSEELSALRANKQDEDVDILRNQDTDQDGLSDYDELYFYNSSPYLEDTDSDGIKDMTEIEQGQDPNCPLGQECFNTDTQATSADNTQTQSEPEFDMEAFNNYVEQSQTAEASLDVSDADLEKQIIEDILSGQADASSLRELLKRSGMDENMLNQISDDDLINTYKNTLQNN